MFGTPKPAFGQATATFGGFNTTNAASPFSQNTFGKPAGTGFAAAPAFGAPTAGSTLFGTPAPTTGGLFGQPAAQTGFGFPQNTSGSLFGAAPAGSSLFGQSTPATQTFGTKPTGFGSFGSQSTAPVGGLFGSTGTQMNTGLFGQTSAAATPNTGLFGQTAGFGATGQSGTYIKFTPVSGTDMVVKNGQPQSINTQHHCITCMKEYENKSLEELRYEDYLANRKGGGGGNTLFGSNTGAVTNTFGQPNTSAPLFGQPSQDKPGGLFGQPTSTFGQSTVFGKPATTGFGAQPVTSNAFAFGTNAPNQSTSLFGTPKPFGAAAPVFPTTTQGNTFRPAQPATFSNFGNIQQPAFGAKPETNAFGMPQTTTTGAFGFGATPAQNTGEMFGAKPATSGFGTGTSVFGTATPFGAPAPGTNTGTMFPTFGAKPAETAGPLFGNFNAPSATNPGLGTGLNLGGGGIFGAKPAGSLNLFGTQNNTQPGNLFGNTGGTQLGGLGGALGAGSAFGTGNTGLGGFGTGGLGTTGNWAGTNIGGGLNLGGGLGNNAGPGALGGIQPGGAGVGVHDRLISLTRAYPYGYSSLLKDLSPGAAEKIDDVLKPTNPAAQRAVMESDKYRVSPSVTKLRVKPLHAMSKKSLFDGLEEDDPSIQKFALKTNIKRLVLRPKAANNSTDGIYTDDVNEQYNNSANDNQNNTSIDVRVSNSIPRDITASDYDREIIVHHSTEYSPSNIQKRVGLDSPRGRVLKSPLNASGDADNLEDSNNANRRSSWLQTKTLMKKPSDPADISSLDNTVEQLLSARTSANSQMDKDYLAKRGLYPDLSTFVDSGSRIITQETRPGGLLDMEDKENIESPTSNDDGNSPVDDQPYTPHPTGIKLTRPGYYTLPSLEDLKNYIQPDGKCIVPQFTIGRRGYGNVFFDCEIDVANLDLDQLVHVLNKEIIVYPDDDAKPPTGEGLNRPAQVTLDCVWPIDKTLKTPISQPEKLAKMDYEGKLRRVCNKHGTRFIEYRPQTGSWVFKVPHFSKYGLTNSDEEDETQADGKQQKQAAAQPLQIPPQTMLRGLGGFLPGTFSTASQSGVVNQLIDHNEQTMDNVSLDIPFVSRLNGINKGQAMDTSEENSMDSAALYPEVGQGSFYGSKDAVSPTSQMARLENQSTHRLQLMKASFFNTEQDLDDMASVTDQMVPQLTVRCGSVSSALDVPCPASIASWQTKPEIPLYSGLSIKQPIVQPKSVVLQYHKKVLPYKNTIAGRYGFGNYADLSIALARLLRIGWGPGLQLTTFSTHNAASDKGLGGDLLALENIVQGRQADDYSKQLALRLQIAGGGPPNKDNKFTDSIENFMQICLKYSKVNKSNINSSESCPHISPLNSQLEAANEYLAEASRQEPQSDAQQFGISPSYWREVWGLCIALWGEHGDSDADPNMPNGGRLLGQHIALSEWLQNAASAQSDDEPTVFSLLAARQVYNACQMAQKSGDYYMAIMLSQIGGEMRIRQLAARQLGLWRETCADQYIDPIRLYTYGLLAGYSRLVVSGKPTDRPTTKHVCMGLDWIRAFGLHFWYICEPVATVADAIRAYEKSFSDECRLRKSNSNYEIDDPMEDYPEKDEDVEFDLTTVDVQDVLHGRVPFPSPPYDNFIEEQNNKQMIKHVLDMRYQLMTLRAFRWKPIDSILNPASHTPDPLDFRLSWLVQQFLEGIGYSHWSEKGLFNIISGFATQLESHGLWNWAIFVLQHIKNDVCRNQAVKELVMRYAGNSTDDSVQELLDELCIPRKWIYEAKSLKAKYEGDGESEAYWLTQAEQYADAHKVIINKLAPSTILNEKPHLLRKLLKPLCDSGSAGHIPHWSTGGHLLLEFLDICDEVNLLRDVESNTFSYQCEVLKMRLASASSAVTMFPTPTLKHTVARCEIGARLASIGLAIAGLGTTINRTNAAPLLNLLNRMDLPSDYIRRLLDKVSDSLTEEPDSIMYSETMSSSSEE